MTMYVYEKIIGSKISILVEINFERRNSNGMILRSTTLNLIDQLI